MRRALLPLLLVLSSLPAAAAQRGPYEVDILVDGRPLAELPHAGRTYVEALRGREYSVRLVNRTGERVAVALAVDGLNSIDARHTAAREARKWILGPWETIVLDGWQTSGSTARRFFFTGEKESYGAWLGKTDDLGVISAAFFRERRPAIAQRDKRVAQESARGAARPESAPPRSAPPSARSEAADEMAATGIGREVDHRVRTVEFEAESAPAAVIDLRYEYRDALVSLGVLPLGGCDTGLARRERARGFDGPWAPDPFK